jgi:hypothetical protein
MPRHTSLALAAAAALGLLTACADAPTTPAPATPAPAPQLQQIASVNHAPILGVDWDLVYHERIMPVGLIAYSYCVYAHDDDRDPLKFVWYPNFHVPRIPYVTYATPDADRAAESCLPFYDLDGWSGGAHADLPVYDGTVAVYDGRGGSATERFEFRVLNLSPKVDAHPVPPNVTTTISLARTGGTYYEIFRWADVPVDAPWTVVIDWGDGTSDTWTDTRMGKLVYRSHTYPHRAGVTYTGTIRVRDKDYDPASPWAESYWGGEGTATFTVTVTP